MSDEPKPVQETKQSTPFARVAAGLGVVLAISAGIAGFTGNLNSIFENHFEVGKGFSNWIGTNQSS
jgi:hypothetical protein